MDRAGHASLSGGRHLVVRGHEVVVHTEKISDQRHLSFVFLVDPYDASHEVRIFKGRGASAEEAEESTLRDALAWLDRPTAGRGESILAGRNTLDVAGRKVDIFCDVVGEGKYQAFPFLYRPDGSRVIILQFHLKESVTGPTPGEAMTDCIRRLEEYFLKGGGDEEGPARD